MASKQVEIYSNKWNFEETIYKDNSIKKSYFKEYQELNRNQNDEKLFLKSQDFNVFINPSNRYIRIEGKLLKLDGSNLDATDNVTITKNGFNLFSRAEYKIENKKVETVDHPGYVTLINNFVEFSDDYGRSAANNMFWFPDTNETADDNEFESVLIRFQKQAAGAHGELTKETSRNEKYNQGFHKKKQLTKNSQRVYFYLPLRRLFGFLKDNDKVFTGLVHKVELRKNSDKNFIHSEDGGEFEFKLTDISWFVPILEPSLSVLAVLTNKFAKGLKSKFYWKNTTTIISKKESVKIQTWRVTALKHKPIGVYIGFQRNGRIERESAWKHLNMIFDDVSVTDIQVTFGNKTLPENNDRIVKTDLEREFMSFQSAGVKDEKCDIGTSLDFETFKKLYPIFYFNFTHFDEDEFTRGSKDLNVAYEIGYEGDYNIICVIEPERKSRIQMIDRKAELI